MFARNRFCLVYKGLEIFHSRLALKIYQAHVVFHMTHRTLRDRDAIPPPLKTIPSSSLSVGESVLSVFVTGNDTTTWKDKERRQYWQKARGGTMYPGLVSLIDHDKHILNVDFNDGDKAVGVPFNLVKRQDGQFCEEAMSLHKRRPGTKPRKTTRYKAGYKWRHTGVHRLRFEEPKFAGQPLAERMMISNTYDLLINGTEGMISTLIC